MSEISKTTSFRVPRRSRRAHPARRAVSLASAIALACTAMLFWAGSAMAEFGIQPGSFTAETEDAAGNLYTQAGGHPYQATTSFALNEKTTEGGLVVPDDLAKDMIVELPPGFVGNPQAIPTCTEGELVGAFGKHCPPASQVGTTSLDVAAGTGPSAYRYPGGLTVSVYNLTPGPHQPGLFGFVILGNVIHLAATARTDSDYGLTVTVPNVSQQMTLYGSTLTFWGTPADPSHDAMRGVTCYGEFFCMGGGQTTGIEPKPFLTNPTDCSVVPSTTLHADSWQNPGVYKSAVAASPAPTDCSKLAFEPTISVKTDSPRAGAPAGYTVNLRVPQQETSEGLATPELRKAVVTMPKGVTVSPSAASGLAGCSDAQIAIGSNAEPTCPDASNIGTVSIDSPLLAKPLSGQVYLGTQTPSQLLRLFLVVKGQGLLIKLPGTVDSDPVTGQLTATFDNNPQLPFEELELKFDSGPSAPLVNPSTCGTYTTTTELTPWSAPASGPPASPSSSFVINQGCGDAAHFNPSLQAGTVNPVAGGYSPFQLNVSREDGSAELSTITAKLPAGLVGKLAGIPYCSDAALGAVPTGEGTGAAQIANPSCPAASQVGTVGVAAGAGPNPFYLDTGKAYLAGPYKGAPLSIAFINPAVAGPFDLGNVLVRAALRVDPATAQIEAVSDPLPTILHGIPLNIREVRVNMNRDDFTLNPTSCAPTAIGSTIGSTSGATVSPSSRFQAADCGALPFAAGLNIRLKGATGRLGHPALRAVVSAKPGEANIGRAQVNLPHGEFLDQGNLNKTCTKPVLLEGKCPASSVYGHATAWTPLLDKPLEGDVYLVGGYGYKLPALVADLNGQIRILLVGKVDSGKNKGIRNTFELVPDAPVSRFVLEMKGGKKYGLLENSEDLCKASAANRRAIARFTGQNGKVHQFKPLVRNQCGKGKKSTKKNAGHAGTR
jgi:hypothetical protein